MPGRSVGKIKPDRQIDRDADKETARQRDRQACIQTDILEYWHTDRHADSGEGLVC